VNRPGPSSLTANPTRQDFFGILPFPIGKELKIAPAVCYRKQENKLMSVAFQTQLLKVRSFNRGVRNTFKMSQFWFSQIAEHSTPRKIGNALAAKSQKWLKRDRLRSMPYRYTIDPLNVCNLRCPLCPTGLGTLKRDAGKMEFEKFTQIIDQIEPYAYLAELYNWGEPYLHPRIFDMIAYASQRKISVRMSSNFNRFNEEMARKTVASGLDALTISVDGATQETYARYRRKGNLATVLNNIKLLVAEKERQGSRKPFIIFRMLINKYNEHEIDEMRAIAEDLGVDTFTTGTLYVDTTNQAQIDEWLPTTEELSYYDYSAEKLENVWHCSDLWESVTINWDGGLAPCCWLHDHKNDIANVFDSSIKDIWNGDSYISSRRVFAFGGPKEGPVKNICTVCKGRPQYLKD
jgi:MoaA/NifB/PqqE/SkfB family radical SAM enzyme